jgi:hypothetical protein
MFLDIGIGILSSLFVGWILNFETSIFFILGGILLTILPDCDFLYFWLARKRDKDRDTDYKHRDLFHYPLIYLPFGTAVFYILGGKEWVILFLLCSFLHFIHDSIAVGWGIKWFFPFFQNNFAFFYLYSCKIKTGLRKLVFSFDENTLKQYVNEHGDKDWITNIYYKWHPIAIIEFSVFLLSLLVLLLKYVR